MHDFIFFMVRAVPHTVFKALKDNDQELLRGLQAFEITIWTKPRGCESLLSTLIGKVSEVLDFQNPQLDRASKIGIRMSNLVKACGDLGLFQDFMQHLLDHGFVTIERDTAVGEDYVRLSPIWDPVVEDIRRNGREGYTFGSSVGKLLGLGFLEEGLATFRPLLQMASKAVRKNGELSMDEARSAWLDAGGQERKFYEFLKRDSAKAEEIRMLAFNDASKIIISRQVLRAYPVLNSLAQQLYQEEGLGP